MHKLMLPRGQLPVLQEAGEESGKIVLIRMCQGALCSIKPHGVLSVRCQTMEPEN